LFILDMRQQLVVPRVDEIRRRLATCGIVIRGSLFQMLRLHEPGVMVAAERGQGLVAFERGMLIRHGIAPFGRHAPASSVAPTVRWLQSGRDLDRSVISSSIVVSLNDFSMA